MKDIRDRIDDAMLLWNSGRHEGAFLVALIALDAAAVRRYPKMNVGKRFEQFFRDSRKGEIRVEYRGECHPIEHIFYKWLRCELVHEGALPVDIQFMSEDEQDVMSVRAGGAPEYVLKIGHGWFHHMINSVARARETNA